MRVRRAMLCHAVKRARLRAMPRRAARACHAVPGHAAPSVNACVRACVACVARVESRACTHATRACLPITLAVRPRSRAFGAVSAHEILGPALSFIHAPTCAAAAYVPVHVCLRGRGRTSRGWACTSQHKCAQARMRRNARTGRDAGAHCNRGRRRPAVRHGGMRAEARARGTACIPLATC